MAMISALASASARIWWVAAYWTPRASTFRRRTRALELGIEWQRARELPADGEWRQQVERDIATSAVVVPMTADLLADSVERGVPVSRRWRRRHQRAIARLRTDLPGSEIRPAPSPAVAGVRRRAVARVIPVLAAVTLGCVAGSAVHQEATQTTRTAESRGAALRDFRSDCSQIRWPHGERFVVLGGRCIPVFSDQGLSPATRKVIVAWEQSRGRNNAAPQ